jgi:hypothetical protein
MTYSEQYDLYGLQYDLYSKNLIYTVNSIICEDNRVASMILSDQHDLVNSMIYADIKMNHTDTSMIDTGISMPSAITSMIYAENVIEKSTV